MLFLVVTALKSQTRLRTRRRKTHRPKEKFFVPLFYTQLQQGSHHTRTFDFISIFSLSQMLHSFLREKSTFSHTQQKQGKNNPETNRKNISE